MPSALVDYAETHLLYDPTHADLSAEHFHRLWPTQQNIVDLLAGGRQPGYLLRSLLRRDFDAVAPFDLAADPYASAFGRTEENYLWKLNQVIVSGYEPDTGDAPLGLWVRRPAALDPWLSDCFGPFDLAGDQWQIHRGGGLWCTNDKPDVVEMRGTPALLSELRTVDRVRPSGRILVELPASVGYVEVSLGDVWTITVGAGLTPGRVLVTIADGADPSQSSNSRFEVDSLPADTGIALSIDLGAASTNSPGHVSVGSTERSHAVLSVITTQDSELRLDLSGLELTTK